MIDRKFSIERQYQNYLEQIGLTEEMMTKGDRTERKLAFYAGAGKAIILIAKDMDQFSRRAQEKTIRAMGKEIHDYCGTMLKK